MLSWLNCTNPLHHSRRMEVVFTAIVPTLLLLAGGVLLRRQVLTDEKFWSGLAWMSYWVFTPALFITAISATDRDALSPGPLLLSLAVPIVLIAGLALLLGRAAQADGPQLTSLVQGSIRINTYVGLIFASALHGQAGVAIFALASAVVVPLVNLVCVSVLAVHGKKREDRRRPRLWRELVTNPLILGCAVGLLLSLFSFQMPESVSSTLSILSEPALACGTLIAGAALRFSFRRRDLLDISIATVLKLIVLPGVAVAIAVPLGVRGAALTSIVLICSVPTAPSAYILAARMGGDARLIAAITGTQTIAAAATIPLVLTAALAWPT